MPRSFHVRLSAMMFLQYFVPGATMPILSYYLKDHLEFEPFQVGLILSMRGVAAFVAPFVAAHTADRYVSAERMLGLCHFVAAVVMAVLSFQTELGTFLALYLIYSLLYAPTMALTNAVAFHHLRDPTREFAAVRVWGTVGWFTVAWVFGYFWLRGGGEDIATSRLADALKLSAIASCLFGVYALALPRSRVAVKRSGPIIRWDIVKTFARPSLALLCGLTFAMTLLSQFYIYGMGPFLNQAGFADAHIMPALSLGQVGELAVFGFLGIWLTKYGIKWTLLVGALAYAIRYTLFAAGLSKGLILAAIPLHGLCYPCFFITAFIYVDQHSSPGMRAGTQQLFNIIIGGCGVLAGRLIAGKTAEYFLCPETGLIDFRAFWSVPATFAVVILLVIALFFKEEPALPAADQAA